MARDDSILKARSFHTRAQENVRLAEAADNAAERRHYRTLAEHYLMMAEAELEAARGASAVSNAPGKSD
jgi:hypothetical protein